MIMPKTRDYFMFPCALGRVVGRADIRYNVALLSSGNRGRGTELTAASPPAPSAAPAPEIPGSCWMDRPPLCLIRVRRRVSRMSVPPTGAIHVRPLLHIPGGISIAPTVASACSRGGGTFISFYVTVRRPEPFLPFSFCWTSDPALLAASREEADIASLRDKT